MKRRKIQHKNTKNAPNHIRNNRHHQTREPRPHQEYPLPHIDCNTKRHAIGVADVDVVDVLGFLEHDGPEGGPGEEEDGADDGDEGGEEEGDGVFYYATAHMDGNQGMLGMLGGRREEGEREWRKKMKGRRWYARQECQPRTYRS